MPDEEQTLSPPAEGMETPKPDAGNESASEGTETPPATGQPTVEDLQTELNTLRKNYADSTRAGQFNYQRAQMLEQQLAFQRQQPQQPQRELNQFPPQAGTQDLAEFVTPEEEEEYNNAIIDGKHDRARAIMAKRDQRILDASEKRVMSRLQQGNQTQARIGESVQAISQHKELNDPANPVTQRTLQLYAEMLQQKQFGAYSYIADDWVPAGGGQMNPHLLNMAVMRAKSERVEKRDVGQQIVNASNANFTEPSNSTAKTAPRKDEPILSEDEKRTARAYGMSDKDYWMGMDPDLRDERKRQGRVVVTKKEGAR